MPKYTNHNAIIRQWQLLRLIPSRQPGITASELVQRLSDLEFKVSKRTVERDLDALSSVFGLSYTSSIPYGWYWTSKARLEIASLNVSEAVSLVLAEGVLRQTLPVSMLKVWDEKFTEARRQLSVLTQHPLSGWTKKVRFVSQMMPLRPPTVNAKTLDTVKEALLNEKQIMVNYTAFNQNSRKLTLHPLSIVQRDTVSYLIATVHRYKDPLLFALHRMGSVKILEQNARILDGYSVDQYLEEGAMQFGSLGPIRLKAIVSGDLGTHLQETPLSQDQKVVYRHGHWQLTATVLDTWQLRFWILSQGPGITVLAPKKLRQQIIEKLQSSLDLYQK